MSIRGKIIDGTKLDGFLLQEENTIIGLVTYTFFGDICEIVSLDSKRENNESSQMIKNMICLRN